MATEEGRQLRNCWLHELRLVVDVDVGCAFDDVEFLRILGLLVDILAPEERVSLETSDDEQRPGRDRFELFEWEEGYLPRKDLSTRTCSESSDADPAACGNNRVLRGRAAASFP